MELRQLKYFLTVARYNNFSKAADHLFIAQPNLSYQIKLLEEELNCKLFERNGRSVHITPQGQALLGPAQRILEEADGIADILHSREEKPLRLGISLLGLEFMEPLYIRLLGDFLAATPDVSLSIDVMTNDQCRTLVTQKELDLAFIQHVNNERLQTPLKSIEISQDRHVLLCNSDYAKMSLQELIRRFPLILFNGNPKGRQRICSALGLEELYSNIKLVSTFVELYSLVRSKRGVGIVSWKHYVRTQFPDLHPVELETSITAHSRIAVWNPYHESDALQKLLAHLSSASSDDAE